MSSELECDYCGTLITGRPVTEGPDDFCSYDCLNRHLEETDDE